MISVTVILVFEASATQTDWSISNYDLGEVCMLCNVCACIHTWNAGDILVMTRAGCTSNDSQKRSQARGSYCKSTFTIIILEVEGLPPAPTFADDILCRVEALLKLKKELISAIYSSFLHSLRKGSACLNTTYALCLGKY